MTGFITPAIFHRRLEQAAAHFPLGDDERTELIAQGSGAMLHRLAELARDQDGTSLSWLLYVVVTGVFPTTNELRRMRRRLELVRPEFLHRVPLEAGSRVPDGFARGAHELDIVSGTVVADVDFCAKHAHNTGIQRVVRQTMARWHRDGLELLPVAWDDYGDAMRRLSPVELQRVVNYGGPGQDRETGPQPLRLVVPFDCTVLVMEVPSAMHCAPLEALAEFSGNRVGLIGYDAIPVVSAETVPPAESNRFVDYLSLVKHSDRVVGISEAATEEFAGFARAVAAQGLEGPETSTVALPVDIPDAAFDRPELAGDPQILVVGSHEPRKNHDAILYAAEVLWREGLKFSLTFIGSGSVANARDFDRKVGVLEGRGRAIEVLRRAKDAELLERFSKAAFTVFPSLHEGYGLPVAESLALGVPVITTAYGSTAEIAADGGCLVVDPRDDDQLVDAMRRLLTEPELVASLRREIAERPSRTWDDYATELWDELAQPIRTARG